MKITTTMKKILLLIGILVSITAAQVVFGQIREGVITYEVKINTHRTLPPDRQEMKKMIPEFRTMKEQLFFNETESIHKPIQEEEEEEDIDNHEGMRMKFRNPNNELYVNQTTSVQISQEEFMGKKFVIQDTLKVTPWKLGTETKQIRGYDCKQATYFNEERRQNIVAWYSDKLRPFLGPERFNTLPGGVLQVDINDGERVITALNVEERPLKKGELKLSSGGIKTTRQAFNKLRDEQLEKMRANGANVIIRN
jgi:GLPGLI family protein